MTDFLRSLRHGLSAALAVIAFLAALAPVTIAAAPDGTLSLQSAAALADDDDDDDDWDDDNDDDDDDGDDDDD